MAYISPLMECVRIESESNFLAGSTIENVSDGACVEAKSQDYCEFEENAEGDNGFHVKWE